MMQLKLYSDNFLYCLGETIIYDCINNQDNRGTTKLIVPLISSSKRLNVSR